MTCGIYAIVAPNGRRYVGQSRAIEMRLNYHEERLNRGKHNSVALQHAYNEDRNSERLLAWRFATLVVCDINITQPSLDELERFHINTSPHGHFNTQGAKNAII